MGSIIDDRGYNQGFVLSKSTEVRMKRRADWLTSKMDLSTPKTIMEIGCGTGEVSYWIAEKTKQQVLGTDLCKPFVDDANEKFKLPNLSYEVLDFTNIEQVRNRKFDYIIGNGILHHLYYHLDDALANLRNLLNENGAIIFIEPNIYNPYCALIFNIPVLRKKANLEPDEMAFSANFIQKKLKKTGFSEVNTRYVDFLLPGVPDFMITPSIVIGDVVEKIPVLNMVSQSVYIYAKK